MTAYEAAERIVKLAPKTLLDIGSGRQEQADYFRSHNITTTTLDVCADADIPAFFPCSLEDTYECVWAAHSLEHAEDPGRFICSMIRACDPDGWIAITVPPAKPDLVGGHLTLWTPELLVYNLIRAGIDCSVAAVGTYRYNISIIVRNIQHDFTHWLYDKGEIEKIAHLFPLA